MHIQAGTALTAPDLVRYYSLIFLKFFLSLLNIEEDIVRKIDFSDIIDPFTMAKNRKKLLYCKVFAIVTFLQFSVSFYLFSGL